MSKYFYLSGLFLIYVSICFSQNHKGYGNINGGYLFGDNSGYSFKLSGGGIISKSFLFGVGVGIEKYKGAPKASIPLFIDLNISSDFETKFFPLIQIQPGYTIYNSNNVSGSGNIYGGIGAGASIDKMKLYFTAGYNKVGVGKISDFAGKIGLLITPSLINK